MGKELGQPDPEHLALLVQVRAAQRQLRCPPRPRAAGDLALLGPLPAPGRHQVQFIQPQAVSGQPQPAAKANLLRTVTAAHASCDPALLPAQQPVTRRNLQYLQHRVPARTGEELLIKQASQAPRLRINVLSGCPAAEHIRQVPGLPYGQATRRGQVRCDCQRGHRAGPAISRGLGTRSTAARSRAGSGCT